MTAVPLPTPAVRCRDGYGHARMPRGTAVPEPERIDRVEYGRFRNVYLYITEACQLRCEHCYMGGRLDRALKMPLPEIAATLTAWRRMGGSKLTILGGEPTLHPGYTDAVRLAGRIGYEHVITTTNAQVPALRKFRQLDPADLTYVQVSLDGGSPMSHDALRGAGTFDQALSTTAELAARGFDTRIICTVNQANKHDALKLLDIADDLGVSLVKYHVFSAIGTGHGNPKLAMTPPEWVDFCDILSHVAPYCKARVWYQPTFARMDNGQVKLNHGDNEFDLFTKPLTASACGGCKAPACLGGCPAEEVITGGSSCAAYEDIVPVCRLWKSSAKPEERR